MYFRYAVPRKACLIQQNHFTFRLYLLLVFSSFSLFVKCGYAKQKNLHQTYYCWPPNQIITARDTQAAQHPDHFS